MSANTDRATRGWIKREGVLAGGTVLVLFLMALCWGPLGAPLGATPLSRPARSPVGDAAVDSPHARSPSTHPLTPALEIARLALDHLRANVKDYTAIVIKRERISGRLGDHQFIEAKIRNRKVVGDRVVVPLSVYLHFRKPKSSAGREVIWVEGRDGGKLVAHEGGFKNLMTVKLKPVNPIAMFGQRYPITEIGIENLIVKLMEKGSSDMQYGECAVKIVKNATVGDRVCTMIQVEHPRRRPYFEFMRARIFIDEEYQLPIRYAAWSWPDVEGGQPVLEEEYTYSQLKVNVGLTDRDFDPKNSQYNFP